MDISHSLTYHITKTGNLLRQVTARRIKQAGIDLTPEESALMNQLWDKTPQTVTELGRWSVKDPSTLTRQIDGLVKKGYVHREHSTQDRRLVLVGLTEKGEQLKERWPETRVPLLDQDMVQCDPNDLEAVVALLQSIYDKALTELKE